MKKATPPARSAAGQQAGRRIGQHAARPPQEAQLLFGGPQAVHPLHHNIMVAAAQLQAGGLCLRRSSACRQRGGSVTNGALGSREQAACAWRRPQLNQMAAWESNPGTVVFKQAQGSLQPTPETTALPQPQPQPQPRRLAQQAPVMDRLVPFTVSRAEPVAVSSSWMARLASAGVTRSLPVARTANCVLYCTEQAGKGGGRSMW